MNGADLRRILAENKVGIIELANKLNMTQPNLSNTFKVQDVKSGLLEKICDALDVSLDFFYSGTRYLKNDGKAYKAVPRHETAIDEFLGREVDAKDMRIKFLEGQVQALKDTILMLGGKSPIMDKEDALQKKKA